MPANPRRNTVTMMGELFPRSEIEPYYFNEETRAASIHLILKLFKGIGHPGWTYAYMPITQVQGLNYPWRREWRKYNPKTNEWDQQPEVNFPLIQFPCEQIADNLGPDASVVLEFCEECEQYYVKITVCEIMHEIRDPQNYIRGLIRRFVRDAESFYRRAMDADIVG